MTHLEMLKKVVSAFEASFPRQHGFYASVSCPICDACIDGKDAGRIWHRTGCLIREAREAFVDDAVTAGQRSET